MPRTDVTILTEDGACTATLHTPSSRDSWPAVILYPDAGGVRETFGAMADRLAGLGYAVLLPDVPNRRVHPLRHRYGVQRPGREGAPNVPGRELDRRNDRPRRARVPQVRVQKGFGPRSGARACFCWSMALSNLKHDGRFGHMCNPTRP
jgi:dienelactone hydrolase